MPGSFFDTNVLLYVAAGDPAKADRAEKLIGAGGTISVQVLNEITNVCRRKMGMSWTETRAFLALMRGLLPVQPLTIEIHETGLALAERYGLSTWDAMIAASALHADCDTLWSEDIQDGIVLDGRLHIRIRFVPRSKTNWAQRLDQPPYEAYAVTTGITFTFGGLKITNDAEVEDTTGHPIPGLYAAGEIIGGLFFHNYASGTGLMAGAVFGRIAVRNAALGKG